MVALKIYVYSSWLRRSNQKQRRVTAGSGVANYGVRRLCRHFSLGFKSVANAVRSSPQFVAKSASPTGVSEAGGFTNYVGRVTSEARNEPDGI